MKFIAHINSENRVQSCEQHSRNVANYAKECLKVVNLEKTGYLAGLLHDCGKFTDAFSSYIQKSAKGESVRKGEVIHSFAGVYYMLKKYHSNEKPTTCSDLNAELIAYAIGSHHNMFDIVDIDDKKNGFDHRLEHQPQYEDAAIKNFNACCASDEEIDKLFQSANSELNAIFKKIRECAEVTKSNEELMFYIGFIARLILSSIVEGDRRDTAEFMNGDKFGEINSFPSKNWKTMIKSLENFLNSKNSDNEIGKARMELSNLCYEAGSKYTSGIYRLNLPTGAGKTLSGLRFALENIIQFKKNRIFYIAPLISILDQNSEEIKRAVGNEFDNEVLIHHSNLVNSEEDKDEELNVNDLLAETWDAPIIVTTLVQFLNSLFDGRLSCVRRFKSLCNSVIIIDEVQTVPQKMLTLFNMALNFLSEICSATILLCSATQPCLQKVDHAAHIKDEKIIPSDTEQRLKDLFKRTNIVDKGNCKFSEINKLIFELTANNKSLLVVCNKKSEAQQLTLACKEISDVITFHLSSAMCMAHRIKVIGEMKSALEKCQHIVCISTQVIEAGVDMSFDSVVRFQAGMDNIVQAAGRCNRNGESIAPKDVYVVNCTDENLDYLEEIKQAKMATQELLVNYKNNTNKYENDLASDSSINFYYEKLFGDAYMRKNEMDYYIKELNINLFELLSMGFGHGNDNYVLRQAFATAGKVFEVIDSETFSVVVPYGKGVDIITELCSSKSQFEYEYKKTLVNDANGYSVSLFKYQFDRLFNSKAIYEIANSGIYVLDENNYDDTLGVYENGGETECATLIL